jgi:hypothetical protein
MVAAAGVEQACKHVRKRPFRALRHDKGTFSAQVIGKRAIRGDAQARQGDQMPEVSWHTMMQEHPRAHLIVGVVSEGGDVKLRKALLARLAKALGLFGLYAFICGREGTHIHCALGDATDAAKLAQVLGATSSGGPSRSPSRRTFSFDDATVIRIDQALRKAMAYAFVA